MRAVMHFSYKDSPILRAKLARVRSVRGTPAGTTVDFFGGELGDDTLRALSFIGGIFHRQDDSNKPPVRLVMVNESTSSDGFLELTTIPSFVAEFEFKDLCKRYKGITPFSSRPKYEAYLHELTTFTWIAAPVFTGEYFMTEVGDELDQLIGSLSELFDTSVTSKESDKSEPEPIAIPEGYKAFSEVFGWVPEAGDSAVRIFDNPNAPELDPNWIWPREETEELVTAMRLGLPCRLVGPTGSGKTKWAENYAAVTGRGFYRISFSESLFLDQLIGSKEIVNGDTCFVKGELPRRMEVPSIILCDEVSRASAGINMAFLQRFLEPGNVLPILDTGEEIIPHEGVSVLAADNTLGLGENSDKYPTANVQDSSTQNRWGATIHLGYMSEESLTSLIVRSVPKLAGAQAHRLARLATLCQNAYMDGRIPLSFSPRQALPIARLAVEFGSIERAFKVNFLNALDDDSQAVVQGFFKTIW